MKAVDEMSQLAGEKDEGYLTDKSGEMVCPSLCVDGDRAGSLHQVSHSSAELPGWNGHGAAGVNHTALRSQISPMRVAKAAPMSRACCLVKHKLPTGVSSVQNCSQVKVVFFLSMAISLVRSIIRRFCGPARSAFFSAGPSMLCPGPAVPFPKGNFRGPD